MNENLTQNNWIHDGMVNQLEDKADKPLELWQPSEFHVHLEGLPLDDESVKQLETEVRALIEAELKPRTVAQNAAENSITVLVAGLGLSAERSAYLAQAIERRVQEMVARNSRFNNDQTI